MHLPEAHPRKEGRKRTQMTVDIMPTFERLALLARPLSNLLTASFPDTPGLHFTLVQNDTTDATSAVIGGPRLGGWGAIPPRDGSYCDSKEPS